MDAGLVFKYANKNCLLSRGKDCRVPSVVHIRLCPKILFRIYIAFSLSFL